MYTVEYAEGVEGDLRKLRPCYRNQVMDAIEEQLAHEPPTMTRNRKRLQGLIPPWDRVAPVRELREGEYRVCHDVDEEEQLVTVRAVRRKRPHETTEETL